MTTTNPCCAGCSGLSSGCIYRSCPCHQEQVGGQSFEERFHFFFCVKESDGKYHISPGTGAAEVLAFLTSERAALRAKVEGILGDESRFPNDAWNEHEQGAYAAFKEVLALLDV